MIIFFDKNWCGKYSIRVNYSQKKIPEKVGFGVLRVPNCTSGGT